MNVHEAYEYLVEDEQLINVIAEADWESRSGSCFNDVYKAAIAAAEEMNLGITREEAMMIADTMYDLFWSDV